MTMRFPSDDAAPDAQPGTTAQGPGWPSPPHGFTRNLHWQAFGCCWVEYRGTITVLVYAALAALLAVPIMTAEVPLGADDLNHLARIYVRAHLGSDPDLARFFSTRTDIIPYLGMDLLLTPLARVLPIMLVGRLYILALVWGLVGAVVVLQRVFTGRIGLEPAASGMLAYNGLLGLGLLTYYLGLILALLLFAAWHLQRERYWLTRLVLFTGAATFLYLTHVIAFVLYGILVASYEVFSRTAPWRTPVRDWLVLAGQAVPALLLWCAISTKLLATGVRFYYLAPIKLSALGSPFLFEDSISGAGAVSTINIICCLAIILYMSVTRGWLTWRRTLAGPVLILLALTVMMPDMAFGVGLLDYRFVLAAVCLALAGLSVTMPTMPRALTVVVLAVLTVVRMTYVSAAMHRCDTQYAELRNALAALPRGVELTTVLERTDPIPGTACTSLPIYQHIAQLVTIERSGFAADFFSIVTSVGVRDGFRADTDPASAETFTAGPPGGFVLWIHLGRHRPPPAGFMRLRQGSFFDLWAVTT